MYIMYIYVYHIYIYICLYYDFQWSSGDLAWLFRVLR